jgi:hypothetical protein
VHDIRANIGVNSIILQIIIFGVLKILLLKIKKINVKIEDFKKILH